MNVEELSRLIETDRDAASMALDQALRDKHGTADARGMMVLHELAVRFWEDDIRQKSFHLTHAYIYALESGDWNSVDALYRKLSAEGRI